MHNNHRWHRREHKFDLGFHMARSSIHLAMHDEKVQMMAQGLGVGDNDDDDDAPVPCEKVQMMAQGLGVEDDDGGKVHQVDKVQPYTHHQRKQNMGRSPLSGQMWGSDLEIWMG